jgi:outer membrane protein TolC
VRARDAAQARFTAGDVPRLELLQTELALRQRRESRPSARAQARSRRRAPS